MHLLHLALANEVPAWTTVIQEELHDWWIRGIKMVPNVLLAIIFLILFFLLAKLFRKLIFRFVLHVSRSKSISTLFSSVMHVVIIALGLYIALNILNLDKIAISLLAGAGIVGLTLAFAFQDLTSNFISGVYIDFNKPFDIGDVIKSGDIMGEVEEIGLRSITIHTIEGLHILVPNKNVFQNAITNYSKGDSKQITINFTLAIQDDLEKIESVIINSVKEVNGIDHNRAAALYFTDIDQNNLKASVLCWCSRDNIVDLMKIKHDAIIAILQGLKDHNIQRMK